MNPKDIVKAYDILKKYNGANNYILCLKLNNEKYHKELTEFEVKYLISNYDYPIKEVNKIIKISDILGEELKNKYELDFVPEKVRVDRIIGEMGKKYHCYIQFRKSVPSVLMYVNKAYFLNPFDVINYKNLDIDFTPFDKKTMNIDRQLKEHQKEAVKFMISNKKCILADSMGLGKSASAVVAAIAAKCKKILVICPATMKFGWRREIKFYEDDANIQIINGSKWKESKKFTIANYDIISNFYKLATEGAFEKQIVKGSDGKEYEIDVPIMVKSKSSGKIVQKQVKSRKKEYILECMAQSKLITEKFDCVIIDEAQKLSNNTSNRYKAIADYVKRSDVEYLFFLTGTPISNNPKNLYNILRMLDADVVQDYEYYMKRYCGGHKMRLKDGREIMIAKDATNLDELRERIKHLYIRRLASDIPEMVNKTISTRYYDLDDAQKERYGTLWDEYVKSQENRTAEETEEYRQLVEGILVRKYLASEMTKNSIMLAEEIMEDDEKVIIVCTFQEEVDIFKSYFKDKCVVYDGRITSPKKKDEIVNKFMTDRKTKVFVGNLNCMGVGLTLTSACKMIFNSYSWEEINNRQAQDRIWRLTQTKDCECIYQLWTDSISQDMFEKVIYKGIIMDTVIKKESEK